MIESAIAWIKRHKRHYRNLQMNPRAVAEVLFQLAGKDALENDDKAWATLMDGYDDNEVDVIVETAEDCEALCRLLRITPEEPS